MVPIKKRVLRPLSIGLILGSGLLASRHLDALTLRRLKPNAAPAPQSLAESRGPERRVDVGDDTAAIHRELRKSIEKFQNDWRKVWQKQEIKRHNYIGLPAIRGYAPRSDGIITEPIWAGDRAMQNMTTDLRRYLAIICNIDSPSDAQIETFKSGKHQDIGTRSVSALAPIGQNARGTTEQVRNGTFQNTVNYVTGRLIQTTPNYGAICPSWVPADEDIPLDEGESIDLAIPVKEREPLRRLREVLIRVLQNAHLRYPKDDWITGQLLRFQVDQRSTTRSLQTANECLGAEELCTRYLGFAQQHANDIRGAELSYRHADSLKMSRQPKDSAGCMDKETLLLLEHDDLDEAVKLSCAGQHAFEERMWWLADPLWSVKGNERYVEHGSRRVSATLRAILDRDERYVWQRVGGGEAMRQLVVRYGWPTYTYWPGFVLEQEISKVRETMVPTRFALPPYTAKEYSFDRTALIPAGKALRDPISATPESFQLVLPEGKDPDSWWPREHMMLWTKIQPFAKTQEVQWRRDTTIVYALVADQPLMSLDTTATGPSTAALVASTGRSDIRQLFETKIKLGDTLRLTGEYPSKPFVISAEVQARTIREAARRLRYGVRPPPTLREMGANDFAISDPVILRLPSSVQSLPSTDKDVLPFIAGDTEIARTGTAALYWESYGFSPTDSVNLELRINRRDDVGIARRIGSALGVASSLRDSISIKWSEPDARNGGTVIPGAKSTIGRTVVVDLKSLPAGEYVATIVMSRGATVSAQSQRRFSLK